MCWGRTRLDWCLDVVRVGLLVELFGVLVHAAVDWLAAHCSLLVRGLQSLCLVDQEGG